MSHQGLCCARWNRSCCKHMTKNKATAQSWSTPAHSPTHLSDTTDSVSLSYWLLRRTFYNCQGGGLTVASARDPGAMCHFGLPAACGHSQGCGTSSIGSRMQQVCFLRSRGWRRSGSAAIHCVFYAPPGVTLSSTQVCKRVNSYQEKKKEENEETKKSCNVWI